GYAGYGPGCALQRGFQLGGRRAAAPEPSVSSCRSVESQGRAMEGNRGSDSGFSSDFFGRDFFLCVVRFNVVVENLNELGDNAVALQRGEQAAIYVDGSFGFLERSGQGNTETGR